MGIDVSYQGYNTAMNYYASLKKQFLQKVNVTEVQFKNQLLDSAKQSVGTSFGQAQSANKVIQEKFTKRIQEIASSPFADEYRTAIQAIQSDATLEEADKQSKIIKQQQLLLEQIQIALKRLGDTETLMQATLKKTLGKQAITHSALFGSYMTYLSKLVMTQITGIKAYMNEASIAGYVQEFAEVDAWKKAGEALGIRATHAGEMTYNSKETPMDIVIGLGGGSKALQKKALGGYTRALELFTNFQVVGSAVDNMDDLVESLRISAVGIQSKLASLSTKKSKLKGYYIGSRMELLNEYQNWAEQKNEALTQISTAKYFGETWTAIVRALGATNLVWTTGRERYFMDEFIDNFRKQNLLLAFSLNKDLKLTAGVKLFDEQVLSD